jgi:hypothetical protein
MEHYNYLEKLEGLWKNAVERYRNGNTSSKTILKDREQDFLAVLGLNVMDLFDYVEDFVLEGEPDWNTFAAICEVRRNYFLERQDGILSNIRVEIDELPPKTEEVQDIIWLPRIIPKAVGKLRGELSADIMYCCGGDRNFFSTHDIHPAEFLRVAWAFENSPDQIVDWVINRTKY